MKQADCECIVDHVLPQPFIELLGKLLIRTGFLSVDLIK